MENRLILFDGMGYYNLMCSLFGVTFNTTSLQYLLHLLLLIVFVQNNFQLLQDAYILYGIYFACMTKLSAFNKSAISCSILVFG